MSFRCLSGAKSFDFAPPSGSRAARRGCLERTIALPGLLVSEAGEARFAALLAAVVAALALAAPASAACPTVGDLEGKFICPTCKTTLDQSDAPAARRMKAYLAERVKACASEEQISDELVAQFGPAVLAAPPREGFHWLAWVLPLVGLLGAAAVISALVWRWSRARPADAGASWIGRRELDPELERRLDRELARFDGD
jgi:cytochrome c-type biogenesis protein CcmH